MGNNSSIEKREMMSEIEEISREDLQQAVFVLTRQAGHRDPKKMVRSICRGNIVLKTSSRGMRYAW